MIQFQTVRLNNISIFLPNPLKCLFLILASADNSTAYLSINWLTTYLETVSPTSGFSELRKY